MSHNRAHPQRKATLPLTSPNLIDLDTPVEHPNQKPSSDYFSHPNRDSGAWWYDRKCKKYMLEEEVCYDCGWISLKPDGGAAAVGN